MSTDPIADAIRRKKSRELESRAFHSLDELGACVAAYEAKVNRLQSVLGDMCRAFESGTWSLEDFREEFEDLDVDVSRIDTAEPSREDLSSREH